MLLGFSGQLLRNVFAVAIVLVLASLFVLLPRLATDTVVIVFVVAVVLIVAAILVVEVIEEGSSRWKSAKALRLNLLHFV